MTQGETWCQALKEVQGGGEIRVRRNTGVTHGRSWNLRPGGSEKLLKFLRRIWVFIFFSYIFCCRKDRLEGMQRDPLGEGAGRDGKCDKSRQERMGDSIKG